jgi:CRP-like cAMP-binding protein
LDLLTGDLAEANFSFVLSFNDFLSREGDPAHALYIVKRSSAHPRGHTVYETVRSGGIVGEMAIITAGAARSASVIAGTYTDLIEINTDRFFRGPGTAQFLARGYACDGAPP